MGYEKSIWQVAQTSAFPPAYLSAENVTDLLLLFPTPLSDQLSNYFQPKICEVLILCQNKSLSHNNMDYLITSIYHKANSMAL